MVYFGANARRFVDMARLSPPVISPEEWQALQSGGPDQTREDVDAWFPLRVWFLLIITSMFAAALLLSAPRMSIYLAHEPALVEILTRFLYFRGAVVVVATSVGAWAYVQGWQLSRVFGLLTVVSLVNLVSDFFIVYPERLLNPTMGFVLQLALRLGAIWVLSACYRNAHRLPEPQDRFNILLPFRHSPSPTRRFHA